MDNILALAQEARNKLNLSFIFIAHPKQSADCFTVQSIALSKNCEILSDKVLCLKPGASINEKNPAEPTLCVYMRKNRGNPTGFFHFMLLQNRWICYSFNEIENRAPCAVWKGAKKNK